MKKYKTLIIALLTAGLCGFGYWMTRLLNAELETTKEKVKQVKQELFSSPGNQVVNGAARILEKNLTIEREVYARDDGASAEVKILEKEVWARKSDSVMTRIQFTGDPLTLRFADSVLIVERDRAYRAFRVHLSLDRRFFTNPGTRLGLSLSLFRFWGFDLGIYGGYLGRGNGISGLWKNWDQFGIGFSRRVFGKVRLGNYYGIEKDQRVGVFFTLEFRIW